MNDAIDEKLIASNKDSLIIDVLWQNDAFNMNTLQTQYVLVVGQQTLMA